jgi:serpin B
VDALRDLGSDKAFDPMNADFSGMTDTQAFISDILQKTHIAIDENGVEASAYTEICFAKSCEPSGHAEMILDRPFIYGIQSRYGDLLFIGVCNNPTLE